MTTEPRCYTVDQVCDKLHFSRTTFNRLKRRGKLPWVEEIRPRFGSPRFRADLVDQYLANEWGRPRLLVSHRRA